VITAAHPAAEGSGAVHFDEVALLPHAKAGAGAVHSLSVCGTLRASGTLTVEFALAADLQALRLVPAVCQPKRRDELWRHTCFELFARHRAGEGYAEFNFSPCGDWAAYLFDGYRDGRREAVQRPIEVSVRTAGAQQIRLRANLDLHAAFAEHRPVFECSGWAFNCAAVIEDIDGALSYWAAHHPRNQPDFHDARGFAISPGSAQAQASAHAVQS